jgi:hypothetical protein
MRFIQQMRSFSPLLRLFVFKTETICFIDIKEPLESIVKTQKDLPPATKSCRTIYSRDFRVVADPKSSATNSYHLLLKWRR